MGSQQEQNGRQINWKALGGSAACMSRPPCLGPNVLTIKVSSSQIKKKKSEKHTSIFMPENYDRF